MLSQTTLWQFLKDQHRCHSRACSSTGKYYFTHHKYTVMLSPSCYKQRNSKQGECKKLKQDNVDCYVAGAGVSEPGLNRRPDFDCLRYGGGLKILWRRPSCVQVPPPAPLWQIDWALRVIVCTQIIFSRLGKMFYSSFFILGCHNFYSCSLGRNSV